MASNSWLAYKRDTRYLLKWIIDRSNSILKPLKTPDEDTPQLNTTGAIHISDIVYMSRFISRHLKEIPPVVFRIFKYVIAGRTAYYDVFQAMLAERPDPELERNNQSHKYVIDAFKQAFDVLGGPAWQESQTQVGDGHGADDMDSIFTNKFSVFKIADDGVGEDGDSDKGSETEATASSQARNRPQKKKPKKGARGKKSKTKPKKATSEESSPDDIPLESYRVIEAGDENIMTDYLIGAYALVKEWVDLRAYIQGQWRAVAYDGTNSVIAAALTNLAIAMVKRTAALISIDFPGPHDTYKTVIDTIIRGDPKTAQVSSVLNVFVQGSGSSNETTSDQDVDVREQLLLYTYQDLLDFIRDFQKTRSGKPTKAMQKDLKNWDPNADLRRLSKEERLQWRRRFTINWLYDFINVFTYGPVAENREKGKQHDLSQIDWSSNGPWWSLRTLWGLKDFAANIAHWAYQKEGTDNSRKVLPHHVFELSCIVDSLTNSRGWSLGRRGGHVLEDPAQHFSSTRDIDMFLDRDKKKYNDRGYLPGIDCLLGWLSRVIPWDADRNSWRGPRNKELVSLLEDFQISLGRTLGVVGKFIEHATGPNWTRFGKTEHGIWSYSPFLCGAGLMEALEIAYRVSMKIWDETPEPLMMVHLYNMLLKEGYLDEKHAAEFRVFATLRDLFADAWFADGKAPTCNFCQALNAQMERIRARGEDPALLRLARYNHQTAMDIQSDLDLRLRRMFHTKSNLILYREVAWNPERIEDADIHMPSFMGLLRVGHTKSLMDPETGRRSLEDTEPVKQARALGIDEASLVAVTDFFRSVKIDNNMEVEGGMANAARNMVPGLSKDSDASDFLSQLKKRTGGGKYELEGTDLLSVIRQDIEEDVVGLRPLSGTNYVWIVLKMMIMWKVMEDRLSTARNRLYIRAYEDFPRPVGEAKRVRLTFLALQERDDECLNTMASCIEEINVGFIGSYFWDNDRSLASRFKWGVFG